MSTPCDGTSPNSPTPQGAACRAWLEAQNIPAPPANDVFAPVLGTPAGWTTLWKDVYTDPATVPATTAVSVEVYEFWSLKGVDVVGPAVRALGPTIQQYARSHGSDLYGLALQRIPMQNVTLPQTYTLPSQVCLGGFCVPVP